MCDPFFNDYSECRQQGNTIGYCQKKVSPMDCSNCIMSQIPNNNNVLVACLAHPSKCLSCLSDKSKHEPFMEFIKSMNERRKSKIKDAQQSGKLALLTSTL